MQSYEVWQEKSYEYLMDEITRLRQHLYNSHTAGNSDCAPNITEENARLAFNYFSARFLLNETEHLLLLFITAWELKPDFRNQCGQFLQINPPTFPSLSLISYLIPDLNDCPLPPYSPFYTYSLLDAPSGYALPDAPLKLKRWALYYLMGYHYRRPDLPAVLHPQPLYPSQTELPRSYQDIIHCIAQDWHNSSRPPLTQLCSNDTKAHQYIAAAVAQEFGYQLVSLNASALDRDNTQIQDWLNHWKCQSRLHNQILLLTLSSHSTQNPLIRNAIAELITSRHTPLLLSLPERLRDYPDSLCLDIPEMKLIEQLQQWQLHLGEHLLQLNGQLGGIVAQFNLPLDGIERISERAITQWNLQPPEEPQPLKEILWQICRSESRSSLEGLVDRIEPKTTWDELILPDTSTAILKQIITNISQRSKVYGEWGMGGNTQRGKGVTSLFYGPPGTGKTTAAEIIAKDLQLDLYRVDLSQVVSKYIGETEKNLDKVFDAAELSGAVLLFDEADAMIGKRSEVKDSKDRYANQEVSFVLQRMEAYSGLAVLTTNLPNAIDSAFMRRIKYSVRFEYPTPEQRITIWQKCFPPAVPHQGLRWSRLAQLNVSGANIKNIALESAFIAARTTGVIEMAHILEAARMECQKNGRPLTNEEIRGWLD
jgi:hypothetical protein